MGEDRRAKALRFLAAASSGALLVLVSPPLNLWWLHYLSFVPVLWALRSGTVELKTKGNGAMV